MTVYKVYFDSERTRTNSARIEAERVEVLPSGVLAFYEGEGVLTDADGTPLRTVSGESDEPVTAFKEWHSYDTVDT